jgi:LysR family malonate utilization transcriptional regulator
VKRGCDLLILIFGALEDAKDQKIATFGSSYKSHRAKRQPIGHNRAIPKRVCIMLIDEELTLKKLEVFLAFMRTGNLARAAAELQTSNVSVHRAIHSLESALRCPLFKHEGRNLTPLESAYVLEERAQKLIQDVVETVRLTREAAGFSAERFKLGSLYSLTVKTVPQLIMGLKIRRSELNIDLILGSNFDLLYKLKNMEVDAILVSLDESVNDPDCEHIPLFSDDIFLATPADSKFAQRTEVDLAEVRDETFITLTQGFATHQDGNRVFKQAGFEPKVAMQVNDIFTLLSMVSSGVGYALLPGRIAAVYENRVKLIPLQEKYRLQQHIGVVFLKAKERDPNLLALLAECRMYANRNAAV